MLGGLAVAAPVDATTAFGLTTTNTIVVFDTSAPATPLGGVTITGLQPGETALAIDLRPSTGQLYVLGSASRLYVVDPATGAAVAVGAPFALPLSGTRFGFDFNPVLDSIYLISDTGEESDHRP